MEENQRMVYFFIKFCHLIFCMYALPSDKIKGLDLEGKVMGVIGLGRIGRAVSARAKGFEMKTIAYDSYMDKELAKEVKTINAIF